MSIKSLLYHFRLSLISRLLAHEVCSNFRIFRFHRGLGDSESEKRLVVPLHRVQEAAEQEELETTLYYAALERTREEYRRY